MLTFVRISPLASCSDRFASLPSTRSNLHLSSKFRLRPQDHAHNRQGKVSGAMFALHFNVQGRAFAYCLRLLIVGPSVHRTAGVVNTGKRCGRGGSPWVRRMDQRVGRPRQRGLIDVHRGSACEGPHGRAGNQGCSCDGGHGKGQGPAH